MVYASLADRLHYGRMFARKTVMAIFALWLAASVPASLGAQCLLCETSAPEGGHEAPQPLAIDIEGGLDFERVAVSGSVGGSVVVDPISRSRRVTGALSDLGGLAMTGSAIVRGEPGRAVRISLPDTVSLRSPGGSAATITRLRTDLPDTPRLDGNGRLRFSFGGALDVVGDMEGDYRGRITITVDYQ